MATKQLAWLIALLVATPGLYVACGGDDSSSTTTTATTGTPTGTGGGGGTGGSTGTGGSAGTGTGTGGSAGTGTGTGGSAGTGTDGSAGRAGGTPEAGVTCGGMVCTTNPTGNNMCDTANNRCVDCLTDMDCSNETLNHVCDIRPTGMAMLPAYNCIQCLDNSTCPAGSTCSMTGNTANTCVTACGTANCTTNPTGNNVCDLPNNRCVGCLMDMDCADETTDKICDMRPAGTMMLPAANCVQCIMDAQCPTGQICSTTGNTANTCVTSCGTTNCTTVPTGTNICDLPNNRCVDCLTDVDCEVETNNKHCDVSVNPTNMLPRDNCVVCTADSHCAAGQVCVGNNCQAACSSDAQCSADGGGMAPHCNTATKVCQECVADSHCSGTTPYCIPAGTCEQCLTDAHCMTAPRVLCNLTNNSCVQCIDSTQCTAPQTCGRNGTCTGGGMDGGGPG